MKKTEPRQNDKRNPLVYLTLGWNPLGGLQIGLNWCCGQGFRCNAPWIRLLWRRAVCVECFWPCLDVEAKMLFAEMCLFGLMWIFWCVEATPRMWGKSKYCITTYQFPIVLMQKQNCNSMYALPWRSLPPSFCIPFMGYHEPVQV